MWNILENLGHFKYGAPYAICNFKVLGGIKRKKKKKTLNKKQKQKRKKLKRVLLRPVIARNKFSK